MGFVVPVVTDKEFLLRLLSREDEVALAKQPGQGRQEALQSMRQAAETLGSTTPWQASHEDPSVFGAAEHERKPSWHSIKVFSRGFDRMIWLRK